MDTKLFTVIKGFMSTIQECKTKPNKVERHPSGNFDCIDISNPCYKGEMAIITDNKISVDTIFNNYSNIKIIIGSDGIYFNTDISNHIYPKRLQEKLAGSGIWRITDNNSLLREEDNSKRLLLEEMIEKVMNHLLFTKCVCEKCGNYSYIHRIYLFLELENGFHRMYSYPKFLRCGNCNKKLIHNDSGFVLGHGRGYIGDTIFGINANRYWLRQRMSDTMAYTSFEETGDYGTHPCEYPFLSMDNSVIPMDYEELIVIPDFLIPA